MPYGNTSSVTCGDTSPKGEGYGASRRRPLRGCYEMFRTHKSGGSKPPPYERRKRITGDVGIGRGWNDTQVVPYGAGSQRGVEAPPSMNLLQSGDHPPLVNKSLRFYEKNISFYYGICKKHEKKQLKVAKSNIFLLQFVKNRCMMLEVCYGTYILCIFKSNHIGGPL